MPARHQPRALRPPSTQQRPCPSAGSSVLGVGVLRFTPLSRLCLMSTSASSLPAFFFFDTRLIFPEVFDRTVFSLGPSFIPESILGWPQEVAHLGRVLSSHWLPDWGRPQAWRAAPRPRASPCAWAAAGRALGSRQLPGLSLWLTEAGDRDRPRRRERGRGPGRGGRQGRSGKPGQAAGRLGH